MVKTNPNLHIILRILLISLLAASLGLSATSLAGSQALARAFQAADAEDWLNASSYLGKAITYYPWRTELLITAGRYAFLGGDAGKAIEYLEKPVVRNGLSSDDLVLLGEAYEQTGDLTKATQIWKEASDMGGSSRALQHLAETSLQQGEYASAIEFFLSLSRLNPADAELQYQIGLLYAATEPIKSLPYLSTAAVMNPSVAVNSKKLQDEIRTASLFDQPAYTLLVSGRQLGSMGEWQLASEAMKRATEADPEYPDAWAYLGEARQHINNTNGIVNPDAGLSELSHALQLDDQSVIANFLMGLYWERQVDYAKAKSYLEQAASINPADPYIYAELGNILSKEGELPAAQDNFKKAVSLAPKNPTFYRLLAQFALENQIQIRPLALPAARQALMLGPQDPESLDLMAKIMLELEDFHAAEQYARQAVDADPGYAPGYFHLGMAYIFLNQADQARKWLEAARNADTDSWVTAQASRMLDYYFP